MAKYFRYFPTTYYIQNEQQADVVTDVIARFAFEQDLVDNDASYYEYEVKDTDTPEIIADKFYGSPERHWIVLGLNQIIDPQWDWPLQYPTFIKYVDKKYTANGANATQNLTVRNTSTDGTTGIQVGRHFAQPLLSPNAVIGSNTVPYTHIASNGAMILITTGPESSPLENGDRITFDGSTFFDVQSSNITHITLQTSLTSNVSNGQSIFKSTPKTGLAFAQSETKQYFKVVTRTNSQFPSNQIIERLEIDANTYANTVANTFSQPSGDGALITIATTKETRTYYEYEDLENEEKRKIKLLKQEFVQPVEKEFKRVIK